MRAIAWKLLWNDNDSKVFPSEKRYSAGPCGWRNNPLRAVRFSLSLSDTRNACARAWIQREFDFVWRASLRVTRLPIPFESGAEQICSPLSSLPPTTKCTVFAFALFVYPFQSIYKYMPYRVPSISTIKGFYSELAWRFQCYFTLFYEQDIDSSSIYTF